MYLLKFIKWFWTEHLRSAEARAAVGFLFWFAFFIPISVISISLNSPAIIGHFLAISVIALFLIGVYLGICYLRKCYILWESRMFKKLRGDE